MRLAHEPFLQGNLALALGTVGLLLSFFGRRMLKNEQLRRDIGGAAPWLTGFLFLRLNAFWLEEYLPREWLVRTQPTAKIHRDVADFVLDVLVTIPLLKTELKLDETTMLDTSAMRSLVLGLARHDTLGNLFSGLSPQLEGQHAGAGGAALAEDIRRSVSRGAE